MCELYIRDVKKKQVQNFNYLSGIQTGDCVSQIGKYIGIEKDAFQKMCKVIRNQKTKKSGFECYIMSALMVVDAGQFHYR